MFDIVLVPEVMTSTSVETDRKLEKSHLRPSRQRRHWRWSFQWVTPCRHRSRAATVTPSCRPLRIWKTAFQVDVWRSFPGPYSGLQHLKTNCYEKYFLDCLANSAKFCAFLWLKFLALDRIPADPARISRRYRRLWSRCQSLSRVSGHFQCPSRTSQGRWRR